MNASSRNACLDAVASADIFILVIGERGGWRAPSGLLVVEEEFNEARRRRLAILIFLEDCEHDDDAKQLSRTVSDYVNGYFRVRFQKPTALSSAIKEALPPLIQTLQRPAMNPEGLLEYFKRSYIVANEATIRFVMVPERQEEVIDPIRLASTDFVDRLFELGHSKLLGLFSYQHMKQPASIAGDALVLDQPGGNDWRNGIQAARLELHESGVIVIDSNLTGRSGRAHSADLSSIFEVDIAAIEAALTTGFRFSHALFEEVDPYKRYQRFFWNASLSGLGMRNFARNPQPSKTHTMNMSTRKEPALAFMTARPLHLLTLAQPAEEIDRAVHEWTQKQVKSF